MAILFNGNFGGSSRGGVDYEYHAFQEGGSGNNRTIKTVLRLKLAGNPSYPSYYSYPARWEARINGSAFGGRHVKGSETWNTNDAWREFTCTATVNVGSTGVVDIPMAFVLNSDDGLWNGSRSGHFRVSSTNSAPSMSGAITSKYKINSSDSSWTTISTVSNATENSIKVPESASIIRTEWNAGTDDKGESNLTYYLFNQQNDGAWSQIYSGRNRYYEHNIGKGNEGRSYDYYVYCKDADGAKSGNVDASQFQKNSFTTAVLKDIPDINYSTPSIKVAWDNPSNTISNSDFNYSINCDGITVYRATATYPAKEINISIVDTVPSSGAYILKKDIVNKFQSSNYRGILTFVLSTTNGYGTTKTNSKNSIVNMQTNPSASGTVSVSTNSSLSTAYVLLASNNTRYFIPDGTNKIRAIWTAGSGSLGESITYDLFVAFDNGSWELLKSDMNSSILYYDHVIPKQTEIRTIKYRVRTKTSYGTYTDKDSASQTLHYYNTPTLSIENIIRNSTNAVVTTNISVNSSLSGYIKASGSWKCYNKGTEVSVSNGNLGTTLGTQIITANSLLEDNQYDLKITYQDDSGFSSPAIYPCSIGTTLSVFYVNKYGAGTGGAKATETSSFAIRRGIRLESSNGYAIDNAFKIYDGDNTGLGLAINSGGLTILGGGESAVNLMSADDILTSNKSREDLILSADNEMFFVTNYATPLESKRMKFNKAGNLHVPGEIYAQSDAANAGGSTYSRVYHENNKPTPAAIGAYTKIEADDKFLYLRNGTTLDVPQIQYGYQDAADCNGLRSDIYNLTKNIGGNRPQDWCVVRNFGIDDKRNFQIGATIDGKQEFFIRTQNDQTGGWTGFSRILVSTDRTVKNLKYANNGKHYIHIDAYGSAWGIDIWASDKKLKNNIIEKNNIDALKTIDEIQHYGFKYNDSNNEIECGYVAQQLEEINKDFISKIKQGEDCDNYDETDPYIRQVSISGILPYVTKSIQQLNDKIKELESKVNGINNL